ncbi:MAG: alpha/beta hydrolase family protein [Marmoricola sp.]
MPDERQLPTPHGDARVVIRRARRARLALLLQHGAGGGLQARDLVALSAALPAAGVTTILLQQPFSVAGRRIAPRPAVLDECLAAVHVRLGLRTPLVLGGRSAGARSSARMAAPLGAVACLALAFPLHPPGRPDRSRLPELASAGVPTLVVQGERDPFGTPAEFPPGVPLVVVPDADHAFAVRRSAALSQQDTLDLLVCAVRRWLLDEVTAAVAGNGP